MSNLDNAVAELIAAIKSSEQYLAYEREKEKINRFPDLKKQVTEYRLQNYRLQSMTDDEELFHKIEEFEREYEKFRENPIVADFLAAELGFCRMMQSVNIKITEALNFE